MPEAAPVTSTALPCKSALIMTKTSPKTPPGQSMIRPGALSSRSAPPAPVQAAAILWYGVPAPDGRNEHGHHRDIDRRRDKAVVAAAAAPAPPRLCRPRSGSQPPVFRGSSRHPAGGDVVREELQQRTRQGDRVLPHLLWHRRRQRPRLFPIRRSRDV